MRELGLSVLVPRNDWTPRFAAEKSFSEGLIPAWQGEAAMEKLVISRNAFRPVFPQEIAARFLDNLSEVA